MNFLKELFYFFKFLSLKDEQKEIVIYAEHDGYYPVYEGVIKELISQNIKILYITSDPKDPVFDLNVKNLKVIYLNLLFTAVANYIKCKVLLITTPDLENFHLKRSPYPVHYLYLFHSMVSTHMMYFEKAFDHYDSILCVGDYQIDEIREREKKHNLKPKNLIPSGYYRLERILDNHQPVKNDKPTILIAPSWGEQNILNECGAKLIEMLLTADFKVIVRPHPEIVRRNKEVVTSIQNKFKGHENFKLELSVRNDDSLHNADLMICDCSGVALEYAFGTERPVLFLDLPVKIKNENYKDYSLSPIELKSREQIGKLIESDLKDLIPSVHDLLQNKEKYREKIRNLREKLIYTKKNSSLIASEYILKLVEQSQAQNTELLPSSRN